MQEARKDFALEELSDDLNQTCAEAASCLACIEVWAIKTRHSINARCLQNACWLQHAS